MPGQHFVMQPPKVIPYQLTSRVLKAQHVPPCKEMLVFILHLFLIVQLLYKENCICSCVSVDISYKLILSFSCVHHDTVLNILPKHMSVSSITRPNIGMYTCL